MLIPLIAFALFGGVAALGLFFLVRIAARFGVPRTARLLAVVAVAVLWLGYGLFSVFQHYVGLFELAMMVAVSLFGAAYILALGYVYDDAQRRGMPAPLWTLAAFLIPSGIGFLLYLLLRRPLVEPCSRCGHGMAPGQDFCPVCGQPRLEAPPGVA